MPLIHSTDTLRAMSRRLLDQHPERDVILLKNSVMVYAFDASARVVGRAVRLGCAPAGSKLEYVE